MFNKGVVSGRSMTQDYNNQHLAVSAVNTVYFPYTHCERIHIIHIVHLLNNGSFNDNDALVLNYIKQMG